MDLWLNKGSRMCYAAVNSDDVKDLGRQKERKKKLFLVSFYSLQFPFLFSCFRHITSLMLPVIKKLHYWYKRFLQLSSQQWISGGGECSKGRLHGLQNTYKLKRRFSASNKLLSHWSKYKEIQHLIVIFLTFRNSLRSGHCYYSKCIPKKRS